MTRRVPFQGALNFRDIGGYPATAGTRTRWRTVYRSDSLHFLTVEDLAAFDAMDIRAIYDLRRASELLADPGPRQHIHLELPSEDPTAAGQQARLSTRLDGEKWLLGVYRHMLANAPASFGQLFTQLSRSERRPAVIHCVAGKDRTGLAIALLLTALGVGRELVLDDYQLTDEYRGIRHVPEVLDLFVASGLAREPAEGILSAPRWAMASALDEMEEKHDGIEGYLLGPGGMTAATLTALKDALLCRSADA